jgi:hypothetical protein
VSYPAGPQLKGFLDHSGTKTPIDSCFVAIVEIVKFLSKGALSLKVKPTLLADINSVSERGKRDETAFSSFGPLRSIPFLVVSHFYHRAVFCLRIPVQYRLGSQGVRCLKNAFTWPGYNEISTFHLREKGFAMKNRIFLVSLVAMFVSSNMPDAYGETPEVPAYLVTWSASASDSKTYNASRLCFEYTMDASLNTNWFGTMVVGSQGHVLDILQEYNLDSQYDEQEERIGPCFCQDSTIYHLSSRSLSGKDETGGFGAYVDEWITPDDRHVSVGGLFYQGVVAEGFDYFSYGGCYWIDLGSCVSQCDSDSYSEPVPGGPPVDFAIELTQFHIEATDPVGKHFSVNTQIPHLDLCVGTPYGIP